MYAQEYKGGMDVLRLREHCALRLLYPLQYVSKQKKKN